MQCGVAALAMICRHYGMRIGLASLEERCQPTRHGVSLKAIVDAAASLGFEHKAAKLTIEDLAQIPLPCILHWNQNHFVVLYRCSKGKKFCIADPGKGKKQVSLQNLRSHWISSTSESEEKGIALMLVPGEGFKQLKEEARPGSVKLLWGYVRQYRSLFSLICLTLLAACLLQLVMPFLTQWIVDIGIKHQDIGLIWLILLGELMIVAGRTATDFIRRWLLMHISMRINISLVSDFFIKLLRLPMTFFETKLLGDLLQRIGDHSRVQSFLTGQLLNAMFTLFSFVVFGVVLFIYDKLIFSVFLIGSLVYGGWIATFLRKRKILDYELFEQQAINQNRTYEFLTSMQEIKLQDCERRRRWEWEDTQADLYCVQMKSLRLQQTQEAGSIFINEIKNILITVLAATAVINGQITLGAMLAIQYIVGQLNSPVEQIMQLAYSLQDVKISLERINDVHNAQNEDTPAKSLREFPSDKSIAFESVDFKYDKHALKNTVEGISFSIPAGKVTAIVGPSGSGKTTLVKLMLGYYPVDNGKISIAGRDIARYNLKWWRYHCGVVMQEGVIFSESIARNIAVDDNEIDTERMEQAARIACIHEYVMSLPLRYQTKIGHDGSNISHGQKQRILIARAVYKNPDFIFLDEATNSLDARNERAIVENLAQFYKGRTVVIVAHRLSTVKNADQIVVIEGGRVAEIGTHADLVQAQGAYFKLVKNQLELGT